MDDGTLAYCRASTPAGGDRYGKNLCRAYGWARDVHTCNMHTHEGVHMCACGETWSDFDRKEPDASPHPHPPAA